MSETQTEATPAVNPHAWQPVVGEQVVYLSGYKQKPVVVTIVRVTPAGRIAISVDKGKALFKRGSRYIGGDFNSIPCYEAKNYGSAEVCALQHLELLTKKHEEYLASEQEKKRQGDEKRAERDRQYAQEMDETKAAYGGQKLLELTNDKWRQEILPDGNRLYMLHLPVKPQLAERKKGYEICIVKCKDNSSHWSDEKLVVESVYTWFNGNTGSFASCSSQHYKTDEDAVWAAACYCYHNSW